MYVRTTPGKLRKDGTKVDYVQLAHNVGCRAWPVLGAAHPHVRPIGRLDVDAMCRLAGSILRYLGEPAAPEGAGGPDVEGLPLLGSRPMGAAWLLDHLWASLGFPTAIGKAVSGRRLDPRVERVLFALVANWAINPVSKLAALEWAAHDVHLPATPDLGSDPQVAYRAMDVCAEHATVIHEQVFFAVAGRLGPQCDVLLFDTNSTYLPTEDDDEFCRSGKLQGPPSRPAAGRDLSRRRESTRRSFPSGWATPRSASPWTRTAMRC